MNTNDITQPNHAALEKSADRLHRFDLPAAEIIKALTALNSDPT